MRAQVISITKKLEGASKLRKLAVVFSCACLVFQLQVRAAETEGETALQLVLNHEGPISKNSAVGKELMSLDEAALERLIDALDEPIDKKGNIVLAISLWGADAKESIPSIIRAFPIDPTTKTSVNLEQFKGDADEIDNDKLQKFVNQYQSQGKVSVAGQAVELDDGTWKTSKFLNFYAPSAVVALIRITGHYAGKEQEDWMGWWELNKSMYVD